MSLSFDFPAWKLQVDTADAGKADDRKGSCDDWSLEDLEDLEACDEASTQAQNDAADYCSGQAAAKEQRHPSPIHGDPLPLPPPSRTAERPLHSGSQAIKADSPDAAKAPRSQLEGSCMPSEILLLVLEQLDWRDAIHASMVCRHWNEVAAESNELWCTHASVALAAGWPLAPHTGAAVLHHLPLRQANLRLAFKSAWTATQVAVRFMCMRRGYEYLLEAWGALWTAAEATVAIPAAVGALGAVSVAGSAHVATAGSAESAAAGTPGSASAEVVDAGLPRSGGGNGYGVGSGDCVHAGAAGLVPSPSSPTAARRQLPTPLARLTGVGELAAASTHATAAAAAAACTGSPTNAHPARSRHSRISHVDQLWAPCTQTSALQVDDCFNAVKMRDMLNKLTVSPTLTTANTGSSLLLYDGFAVMLTVVVDHAAQKVKLSLAAAERQLSKQVEAWQAKQPATDKSPNTSLPLPMLAGVVSCQDAAAHTQALAMRMAKSDGSKSLQRHSAGSEAPRSITSFADRFADMIRRGDKHGAGAAALHRVQDMQAAAQEAPAALQPSTIRSDPDGIIGGSQMPVQQEEAAACTSGLNAAMTANHGIAGTAAGGSVNLQHGFGAASAAGTSAAGVWQCPLLGMPGSGVKAGSVDEGIGEGNCCLELELDVQAAAQGDGPMPAQGVFAWREVLRLWEAYRRWLEVVVARAGPLAAAVEAERQHAFALLDPRVAAASCRPSPLNKGLLAWRDGMLLGSSLRRPLQAAALWLLARSHTSSSSSLMQCGLDGRLRGALNGGMHADQDATGLDDELQTLLLRIRKLLTELNVSDDLTVPRAAQAGHKFKRCFGRLVLRDSKVERLGLRALH